ncbi:hypothetical protein PENTCL1PPCAC_8863, partial [Pristionchus entomophagus]
HRGLCTRIYDLIAKAKKDVELHMRYFMPTPKQFMTFSRPVTFHFFRKWKPVKDEHFLNVLRRGHSIFQKMHQLSSSFVQRKLLSKQSKYVLSIHP